ncbi:hypothetical protein GW17_00052413 [Ensete ventricosum]|nr:hypothetical protein GW17_00052413 [Ensete ventricosum]
MCCTRSRFSNSGIKTKVFMRKIGFKLRVMRLNHVESFYAFLLRFRSEESPCKGQPGMATASPLVGAADHLQGGGRLQPRPPCRGGPTLARPPAKGRPATARASPQRGAPAHGQTARAAARGWPVAARCPQGAAAASGHAIGVAANVTAPARATASSDSACKGDAHGGVGRRGGRPLAKWLPAGEGSHRLRKGSSGIGGAVKVKEG